MTICFFPFMVMCYILKFLDYQFVELQKLTFFFSIPNNTQRKEYSSLSSFWLKILSCVYYFLHPYKFYFRFCGEASRSFPKVML